VALGAGGGFPVGPVGHNSGEHALAVPVGLPHGPVAGRQDPVPGGGLRVAGAFGSCGLRVGPGRGRQAGFAGAGAASW
jgi:hypothetical protein